MHDLGSERVSDLLAAIAAKTPTPGGGAVASLVGALAAATAQMVVSYSLGKKALAAHQAELEAASAALTNARALLLRLGEEDARAYALVSELSKLPERDPKRAELGGALQAVVQAPMAAIAAGLDLLRLTERLAGITNRQLRSDLGIAALLAEAAARAGLWNVEVNAGSLPDPEEGRRVLGQARALAADASRRCERVQTACGA